MREPFLRNCFLFFHDCLYFRITIFLFGNKILLSSDRNRYRLGKILFHMLLCDEPHFGDHRPGPVLVDPMYCNLLLKHRHLLVIRMLGRQLKFW